MDSLISLTLIGNGYSAAAYTGRSTQSFMIVAQSDGSVGIRSVYHNVALTLSETNVWASAYSGSKWQSFHIKNHPDGSCTIHAYYTALVLEMTDTGVAPRPYIPGSLAQCFYLVNQADRSTGIRKASLVFNNKGAKNDLEGSLEGEVYFAQSHVIPAKPSEDDTQPYLVARRNTLLMIKPLRYLDKLTVTVLDEHSTPIDKIAMQTPYQLPTTAYQIQGIVEHVDFSPSPGTTYTLNRADEISQLDDPSGTFLLEKLLVHSKVIIETSNYAWTAQIYLPHDLVLQGKMVSVHALTTHTATNVLYSNRSEFILPALIFKFKFSSGQWVADFEMENRRISYSENTWSCQLPANWIKPGTSLYFESDALSGRLDDIHVGPPGEVLLNTIDIGMLTPPRGKYIFANEPDAHREYFQTVPLARLIVSNYESLFLKTVILANGQIFNDYHPSLGGWHSGDMRQSIGKELISLGINLANYGINSSQGEGETTPFIAAQFTAHNSCGNYSNGIAVHGGSGGAGIVTLDNSIGNEFSHEVGHNYNLPHLPGGFDGFIHRSAENINSGWGWDADRLKFLPNFQPLVNPRDACWDGQCQPPFYGRPFGQDGMGGGSPLSSFNRYTPHTPYAARLIQSFMESKVVFASDSPTGFRKWDSMTKTMEPYTHAVDLFSPAIVPNEDLSEAKLSALLTISKVIKVQMWDGNWNHTIHVPPASPLNAKSIIIITSGAKFATILRINGQVLNLLTPYNKCYVSNGSHWNECIFLDATMKRTTAVNTELDEPHLRDLLSRCRVLNINTWDGNWSPSIHIPLASPINTQRVINIYNGATYALTLYINGLAVHIPGKSKKIYLSDGNNWSEYLLLVDSSLERRPQIYGDPVTTLVGYYDPLNELTSYIYPALHGGYGFCYADNSDIITEFDCQLIVTSENNTLRFKLENRRIASHLMNKFHINIPEVNYTRTAKLICNGIEVAHRTIEPARKPLTYTVNGE